MRALITAFPNEIRSDFGKTTLFAMFDVLRLTAFPAVASVWFYIEVELEDGDGGHAFRFDVDVRGPDGGSQVAESGTSTAPTYRDEENLAPTWGLRFQVPLTVDRPGPYVFRLRANDEPVTERTLYVARQ